MRTPEQNGLALRAHEQSGSLVCESSNGHAHVYVRCIYSVVHILYMYHIQHSRKRYVAAFRITIHCAGVYTDWNLTEQDRNSYCLFYHLDQQTSTMIKGYTQHVLEYHNSQIIRI